MVMPRTGSPMAAVSVPPIMPALICRKPIMEEADPAMRGKGASDAVIIAGMTKATPKA